MEIEILIVPGCPNEQLLAQRLRRVLDGAGLHATITTRVVIDQAEAEQCGFTGSPTILLDGHDPFAELGTTPSLSCRLYRTPAGPAGLPTTDQLRRAVNGAH